METVSIENTEHIFSHHFLYFVFIHWALEAHYESIMTPSRPPPSFSASPPDPLKHVRVNLRLLCATLAEDPSPARIERFMLRFFDGEVLAAVAARERGYVARMTRAFKGELGRRINGSRAELAEARAQLQQQDKQVDFMRSQLDRRRLEIEAQRRRFIHEILVLREASSKGGGGGGGVHDIKALADMLATAFADRPDHAGPHPGRRGAEVQQGDTTLLEASHKARQQAAHAQLEKLKHRVDKLQQELELQQSFSEGLRAQKDHWEQVAREMAEEQKTMGQAAKQMSLANRFAAGVKMARMKGRQMWWAQGRQSADAMLEQLHKVVREAQANSDPAGGGDAGGGNNSSSESGSSSSGKDDAVFDALLSVLGDAQVMDYFVPRLHRALERHRQEPPVAPAATDPTAMAEAISAPLTAAALAENVVETAAMITLAPGRLLRGGLTNHPNVHVRTAVVDVAAGGDGGIVDCPWCNGDGVVTSDRRVVSAQIETEQKVERLTAQLEKAQMNLHLAGQSIKLLKKKPKRRHVQIQVDHESLEKECGGANAEHHVDSESDNEHEELQHAADKIEALQKRLRAAQAESKEHKRNLAALQKQLAKRSAQIQSLKNESHEVRDHGDLLTEELNTQQTKVRELQSRVRTLEAGGGGGADPAEMEALRLRLESVETELEAARADGKEGLSDHADALGKRLKEADMEITRRKADMVLQQAELNDTRNALHETELLLAEATAGRTQGASADVVRANVGCQTAGGDWGDDGGRINVAVERQKNWAWVTQTYRDMEAAATAGACQATAVAVPEVRNPAAAPAGPPTVSEALDARAWIVSRQAVLNWSVLTQAMLNLMETGRTKLAIKRKRLDWMIDTRDGMRNQRRETTERILTSVTTMLLGGAHPAAYKPSGGFQPAAVREAKFRLRWRQAAGEGEDEAHVPLTLRQRRHQSRRRRKRRSPRQRQGGSSAAGYDPRTEDGGVLIEAARPAYSGAGTHVARVEMGAFPNRRALFQRGTHRVTRIPPAAVPSASSSGLNTGPDLPASAEGLWSNRSRRGPARTHPRRPATARPVRSSLPSGRPPVAAAGAVRPTSARTTPRTRRW